MMVQQLEIGVICIDVIKKNIKNIHLAVYPPTGRVRIVVPLNTDEEAIRLFPDTETVKYLFSVIYSSLGTNEG